MDSGSEFGSSGSIKLPEPWLPSNRNISKLPSSSPPSIIHEDSVWPVLADGVWAGRLRKGAVSGAKSSLLLILLIVPKVITSAKIAAKLPAGTYRISASAEGKTFKRSVKLGNSAKEMVLHWENDSPDDPGVRRGDPVQKRGHRDASSFHDPSAAFRALFSPVA